MSLYAWQMGVSQSLGGYPYRVYRGDIGLYKVIRGYVFICIGIHTTQGLGFPELGVTFWGVPILRVIILWGSILGPLPAEGIK